jgi:hypothetical protein
MDIPISRPKQNWRTAPNPLRPWLNALPGWPFPRNARERTRDWRHRIDSWPDCDKIALLFYGIDELTALVGGALAVFMASEWIDLVLDLENPSEREKLRGSRWVAPLRLIRNGKVEWLTLAARLRLAANDANAISNGGYDGRTYHFDDVVTSAMRSVRDRAAMRGFHLVCAARSVAIVIEIIERTAGETT